MTTETMVIKLLDFSGHYEHVKMPSALCSKLHYYFIPWLLFSTCCRGKSWLDSGVSSSLLWAERPYLSSLILECLTWNLGEHPPLRSLRWPSPLSFLFVYVLKVHVHVQARGWHEVSSIVLHLTVLLLLIYSLIISYMFIMHSGHIQPSLSPLLFSSTFFSPSVSLTFISTGNPLGLTKATVLWSLYR